jgi:hypothetical protein
MPSPGFCLGSLSATRLIQGLGSTPLPVCYYTGRWSMMQGLSWQKAERKVGAVPSSCMKGSHPEGAVCRARWQDGSSLLLQVQGPASTGVACRRRYDQCMFTSTVHAMCRG